MGIDARAAASLASGLAGDLIRPGSPGYDEHRISFNALIDRRPAAVALCETVDDVVASLAFGRANGLAIGVRGGGHSVAGHGLVDDGLVIDLRRMRAVVIDDDKRIAHVAGGAQWLDLDTASQRRGLAVTGGTFVDTGVAGLTLGGGIGFLMGRCGLTCDNLVGAQLVTATGEVLEVSDETEPELLWALRGGGGNFGIVTRLDLRLTPVGRMHGGAILVPIGDGSIIARMAAVQRNAPDGFVALAYALNRDGFGPTMSIDIASLEGETLTRELVAAITGPDPILTGEIGEVAYADIQGLAAIMPFGLRHYWKSAFVPELGPSHIESIVEMVKRPAVGKSGVLLEPLHGAVRRAGFDHAAFPERSARYHVSGLGIWANAADDDRGRAWGRELHAAMTADGLGATYINYISPDEPVDRARSAYPPEVLARLRAVKRRFDPDNLFRANLNIAP